MKIFNLLFRSWYYFRIGYTTYLTFLVSVGMFSSTVYYLAIENIPFLKLAFPHFVTFAMTIVLLGVPLAILVGWMHLKRSPAWKSELDISVEANPYNYFLPPGYVKEVFAPLYLEILRDLTKLLEKEQMLSETEKQRVQEIGKKLEILISGGYVGKPRRTL